MPKKTKPLKISSLVIPEGTKTTVYVSGYNSDGVYVEEKLETVAGLDVLTTQNSFTEPPLIKVVIR